MATAGDGADAAPADIANYRSEIDAYGFQRPEDFDYETYEEFMSRYLSVLARRANKWAQLMGANHKSIKKSRKVKRYIRKGIPSEHRGLVWMYVSGAERARQENPGLYQRTLDGPKDEQLLETIKTDLHRTFPENIYFCNDATQSKRSSLENVLVAYGHHNPAIGYCQGLNFIVAIMLLVVKDEESCFFLLDVLLSRILPDYYSSKLTGLKVDQEVLGELIKQKVPQIATHMDKEDVPWSIPTTKWFICLFLDVLPIETTLRIWDCLFYEGSKVLLRVCIALIKQNTEMILKAQNFPLIVEAFKKVAQSAQNVDCHTFMQNVFLDSQPLSRANIDRLRVVCRQRVEQGQ